jgi:hypothetical protein
MPWLEWNNRNESITATARVPYRLLQPVKGESYGDDSSNLIIEGDNLEALKALLPYYAGQVKCVFIDPPYNTGSAFEHYDDNLEHSKWLNMMYPRLVLLKQLLSEDGVSGDCRYGAPAPIEFEGRCRCPFGRPGATAQRSSQVGVARRRCLGSDRN